MADTPKKRWLCVSARRERLARLLGSVFAGAAVIAATTGCSSLSGLSASLEHCECVDDFVVGYRNSALAAKAWHEHKHCYANQPYIDHFEAGFRAGYESVAAGGNGCTPSIAPREYWGWKYQSPEGQAKVSAWFQGFPMGAKAAEEDGVGNWSQIPTMLSQRQEVPPQLLDPEWMPEPEQPAPPPTGVPVYSSPAIEGMAPTPAPEVNMLPSNNAPRQLESALGTDSEARSEVDFSRDLPTPKS